MRSNQYREALRDDLREAVVNGINEEVCDILRGNPNDAQKVNIYRHFMATRIVDKIVANFRVSRPRRKAVHVGPSKERP